MYIRWVFSFETDPKILVRLQDGSRFLELFSKRKPPSLNQRNTVNHQIDINREFSTLTAHMRFMIRVLGIAHELGVFSCFAARTIRIVTEITACSSSGRVG